MAKAYLVAPTNGDDIIFYKEAKSVPEPLSRLFKMCVDFYAQVTSCAALYFFIWKGWVISASKSSVRL